MSISVPGEHLRHQERHQPGAPAGEAEARERVGRGAGQEHADDGGARRETMALLSSQCANGWSVMTETKLDDDQCSGQRR